MRDSEIKDKLDTRQTTFGEIAVQKGIIDKFAIDKKLIKTLKIAYIANKYQELM